MPASLASNQFFLTPVYALYTFGGLHKAEANLNIFYLHGANALPVYNCLVAAHVNTMDSIVYGDIDAKGRVAYKGWPVKETGDVPGGSGHGGQQ